MIFQYNYLTEDNLMMFRFYPLHSDGHVLQNRVKCGDVVPQASSTGTLSLFALTLDLRAFYFLIAVFLMVGSMLDLCKYWMVSLSRWGAPNQWKQTEPQCGSMPSLICPRPQHLVMMTLVLLNLKNCGQITSHAGDECDEWVPGTFGGRNTPLDSLLLWFSWRPGLVLCGVL